MNKNENLEKRRNRDNKHIRRLILSRFNNPIEKLTYDEWKKQQIEKGLNHSRVYIDLIDIDSIPKDVKYLIEERQTIYLDEPCVTELIFI